ncbi:RHS repeat-associated core domain-containing protein [Ramlibacter sp.]|uniref:RHS repeat-associated core domain-containing protein n=1 Tax=Ramlibacter sp. TaxID=1917967 RepID=UPI003D0DA54D
MVYPSGLKITYRRVNGRITAIDAQPPGGTVRKPAAMLPLVSDLAHTALGQPQSWRWFNGDTAVRGFDADGRMTSTEFATYTHDAAGRITGITQQLWAADTGGTPFTTPLSWQVGYDNRGRVTSFERDGAQTRYTYDPNSNRLAAIDTVRGDTDLDGAYGAGDFSLSTLRNLDVEGASNRLIGFSQTVTRIEGQKKKLTTAQVRYAVDATGSLTSDGLRDFEYDAANRLAKVRLTKDGEAASVSYKYNAFGQRVFKGEVRAEQTLPSEEALGVDFIAWLKSRFGWLFTRDAASTSLGTAYLYGDGEVPSWALVGSYDNGSATGQGRNEYVWLPVEGGHAIPIAVYRGGHFYAIHTDHLGTPRLMTNVDNKPVWQWPYSAFGDNKPTGILAATPNPQVALTNRPLLLKTTSPRQVLDLAFPGQVRDEESGLVYNWNRHFWPVNGVYTQYDPIGLRGGLNGFLYGSANPIMFTDPNGLNPVAGALNGGRFGAAAGSVFGPVGAVAGGILGASAGAAMGWLVTGPMLQEKTPNSGTPGSWHINPGSGQERLYGPDGRPAVDIDWDHDHGQGQPHPHNWGPGGREVPENGFSPWPRGRTNPARCNR